MTMTKWIHLGGVKNIICQQNVTISHTLDHIFWHDDNASMPTHVTE